MKKMILLPAIAAVGLLFAGCASVQTVKGSNLANQPISNTGATIAHVNSQNWGIYLFSIPLLTGATDSMGNIAVLKDTVNLHSLTPLMVKEARKAGATKLYNMASQYSEFGLIFYSRKLNMSANAVR